MSLFKKISDDRIAAMKAGSNTKGILSMACAEIKNLAISEGADRNAPPDDLALRCIGKMVKQRRDNAAAYSEAGAADRANDELVEASVLEQYLPKSLDESEVISLINAAVKAAVDSGNCSIGPVMKQVSPQVRGRFDGRRLSELVTAAISTAQGRPA